MQQDILTLVYAFPPHSQSLLDEQEGMKLSSALAVLSELKLCLQLGFVPTLRAVLRSPTLLLYPSAISRIFMNHVWSAYGDGVDTNSRAVKEGLVTANAQGVVLDIGAGA